MVGYLYFIKIVNFVSNACRTKVDTGFVNSAVAGGQPKAQTKNLVAGGQAKAPRKTLVAGGQTKAPRKKTRIKKKIEHDFEFKTWGHALENLRTLLI